MQLVDELSMIYTTCLMFWATFAHKQSRAVQTLIAVAVAALALFITLYYHFLQDPTFHQTAYALLTAVVLLRSMWIMEMRIRPYFRKQKEDLHKKNLTPLEEDRQDVRDRAILKKMWALVATGLFVFLGGFAIWNLDNAFCSKLRAWRSTDSWSRIGTCTSSGASGFVTASTADMTSSSACGPVCLPRSQRSCAGMASRRRRTCRSVAWGAAPDAQADGYDGVACAAAVYRPVASTTASLTIDASPSRPSLGHRRKQLPYGLAMPLHRSIDLHIPSRDPPRVCRYGMYLDAAFVV
nr:alkaline ceramidase 3 [Quercus suber]